ncbi:MAG: uroporphyrinogen-III C-methyltransferase [Chitinispirillaceae bacterium]|nr:uroporphyrinogen-III C-methyltransferase [Chitinispirillaceae bacterium]
MEKNNGVVYLIGAGPGEAGLITVKGKKLLEQCDVAVYDALVSELLIAGLPHTVRRIFVGKRGGSPSPKQEEINRLLVREARKGLRIARLKGGDPLVFGRGSEEMEYLAAHGIRYEVVPGISSAIAAPAYAGIPVTHRRVSRSFAVVTGHLREGEEIDSLALPQADTLVFLMAMENLTPLIDRLIASGKFTRSTPAALIRNGTLPDQETTSGTLETIAKLKEQRGIRPPAVFIVGETVRFAKALSWRKRLPLDGTRVAVLRTGDQSGDLIDGLAARGAAVLPCPIMRIRPRLRNLRKITASYLKNFTMVIFTSPNGASLFMKHLLDNGADARSLAEKKVYALGGGTAMVLRRFGIRVDALPEKFVAEGVLGMLPDNLSDESILIPRASIAREVLPETLRKRRARVTVLPIYDTVKAEVAHCSFHDGDYVLFTSSSTVEFFYGDPQHRNIDVRPVCIGDITATTLKRHYGGDFTVAKNATMQALIAALETAVRKERRNKGTGR